MIEKNDIYAADTPSSRRTILKWSISGLASGLLMPVLAHGATQSTFSSDRLSIVERGRRNENGRDILLIPGLASGPAIWSDLVGQLQGHRLHLVHIAGFAGKAAGVNAQGALLGPITQELERYIAEKGLRTPAIIGHSMGGTLAMMLALRPQAKVGRVMVIDMLPDGSAMVGGTSAGLGYLATQLNAYFTGTKAGRQLLAEMVRQSPGARDSDPNVVAQALTELARTNLGDELQRITCPLDVVYAVSGDGDVRLAQSRRYRAAYARVPSAHIVGIGPSGHMVMQDQPAKFVAEAKRFLR